MNITVVKIKNGIMSKRQAECILDPKLLIFRCGREYTAVSREDIIKILSDEKACPMSDKL